MAPTQPDNNNATSTLDELARFEAQGNLMESGSNNVTREDSGYLVHPQADNGYDSSSQQEVQMSSVEPSSSASTCMEVRFETQESMNVTRDDSGYLIYPQACDLSSFPEWTGINDPQEDMPVMVNPSRCCNQYSFMNEIQWES